MIRASRLLIIGFLVIAQLIGPLVHAHTGGVQSPGILHLPGLEGFSAPKGMAVGDLGWDLSRDLVVGLAPGLEVSAGLTASSPEPQPAILPAFGFLSFASSTRIETDAPQDRPPPPGRSYPPSSPRAPPLLR